MLQNQRSAKEVRKNRRHKGNCVSGEDVSSSDSGAVDERINSIKSKEKNDKEVKCRMHIGGNVVDFQIDTGASCNLLPKKLAKDVRPYVVWSDSQPTDGSHKNTRKCLSQDSHC